MGTFDIQFALDWLSWRLQARNKKYSQDYLDKMAMKKLHEAVSSPHTSHSVKVMAQNGIRSTQKPLHPGTIDKYCNTLCRKILKDADEKDFMDMLANTPQKLVEWRKLWNAFRGDKIHRI